PDRRAPSSAGTPARARPASATAGTRTPTPPAASASAWYSGPRKLDSRLSYSRLHRQSKKGETDGRHAEDSLGGVQGPGGHGGVEGGQDDQRTGRPVRRPPHVDPCLEEAVGGRGRGCLQQRQQGRRHRPRSGKGTTLRADRPAPDGT